MNKKGIYLIVMVVSWIAGFVANSIYLIFVFIGIYLLLSFGLEEVI